MKRFLIVILLTALLPDVSIWSLYLREVPLLVSILWFLPTTLLTAAWLALVFEFRHSLAARTLNGCILCFVVPKICFLLFQIITPWAGLLAAVTAELLAIYGLTLGWRRLKVRQVRICFPTLPAAFDGYRLLHLSDFHLGTFGRHNPFVRRVIETANQQEADLVVFTGDLVNKVAREAVPYRHDLALLQAPDGVFAILGNHDYWQVWAEATDGIPRPQLPPAGTSRPQRRMDAAPRRAPNPPARQRSYRHSGRGEYRQTSIPRPGRPREGGSGTGAGHVYDPPLPRPQPLARRGGRKERHCADPRWPHPWRAGTNRSAEPGPLCLQGVGRPLPQGSAVALRVARTGRVVPLQAGRMARDDGHRTEKGITPTPSPTTAPTLSTYPFAYGCSYSAIRSFAYAAGLVATGRLNVSFLGMFTHLPPTTIFIVLPFRRSSV